MHHDPSSPSSSTPDPVAALREALMPTPAPSNQGPLPRPRRSWRRGMAGVLILLLVGFGIMSLRFGSNPRVWLTAEQRCQEVARGYVADVTKLLRAWDDADAVASKTSRIALAPQVARLQEIRRAVATLQPPACAVDTHHLALAYMDRVVESYLAFMGDEGGVQSLRRDAAGKQRVLRREFAALGAEWAQLPP
jgi:hypothetical protein